MRQIVTSNCHIVMLLYGENAVSLQPIINLRNLAMYRQLHKRMKHTIHYISYDSPRHPVVTRLRRHKRTIIYRVERPLNSTQLTLFNLYKYLL